MHLPSANLRRVQFPRRHPCLVPPLQPLGSASLNRHSMKTFRQTAQITRSVSAIGLGALLLASAARAEPTEPARATAHKLVESALQLMSAERYTEACRKLEASQRLDPEIETKYHLAECYEKLGRTASAWAIFSEVAEAAEKAGDAEQERMAREQVTATIPHLSYVTVAVPEPVAGLVVRRDGRAMASATWGVAVPVDPGTHSIEATAPHKKPWKTMIAVGKDGGSLDVQIPELEEAPAKPVTEAAPAAKPTTAPKPSTKGTRQPGAKPPVPPGATGKPGPPTGPTVPARAAAASGSRQRTWALISAGAGVIGLGIGTALVISAKNAYSDANRYCDASNRCTDPTGVSLRDTAISRADLANIPLGIGLAGLGLGAVLWSTAPSARATPPRTGLAVAPTAMLFRGSF